MVQPEIEGGGEVQEAGCADARADVVAGEL